MALTAPNVHLLPSRMAGNVYLLAGESLTLVDTGMPGGAGRVLEYVSDIGRASDELVQIVLTHYHVDHVGSAQKLSEQTGAAVLVHPEDAPYVDGSVPQPSPRQALLRLIYRVVPAMSRFPRISPDRLVRDGDRVDILGGALVIHVPGHTPGAIALHLPAEGLLFCGDAIGNRSGELGPPPPAFTVDVDQAATSIRRMAELEFDILCPGHGPPVVGRAADAVRDLAARL